MLKTRLLAPSNEDQESRVSDSRNDMESSTCHVVWGGMESLDSSSISCTSGDTAGTGSQKGNKKERPQRVLTGRVEFLSFSECSTPPPADTEATSRFITADSPVSSFHHASGPVLEDNGLLDQDEDGDFEEHDDEVPDEGAEMPSVGSAQHFQGTCRPCLFAHSRLGCPQNQACLWCHFRHRMSRKPRPCKKKRERFRKLMQRSESQMMGVS